MSLTAALALCAAAAGNLAAGSYRKLFQFLLHLGVLPLCLGNGLVVTKLWLGAVELDGLAHGGHALGREGGGGAWQSAVGLRQRGRGREGMRGAQRKRVKERERERGQALFVVAP